MIARRWTGRVRADRSDEYLAYLQATGRAMKRHAMVAVALGSVLIGCQFVPLAPAVECGTVPRRECEAMARELIEQARVDYPDLRVRRVTFTTPTGGYWVEFTDGSMYAVTP